MLLGISPAASRERSTSYIILVGQPGLQGRPGEQGAQGVDGQYIPGIKGSPGRPGIDGLQGKFNKKARILTTPNGWDHF